MSSAFLYIAIVAIWAFVLIPRWLRRPHGAIREVAEPYRPEPGEDEQAYDDAMPSEAPPAAVSASRSKVLQARRRLLTMLVALTMVAAACTYLKITSWWLCVPPVTMLVVYLFVLRAAARIDAEQARVWAAQYERYQEARWREQEALAQQTAEVIDISDRLGDQLYDQYEDATIRAVGD